jgi:hypothetical protein
VELTKKQGRRWLIIAWVVWTVFLVAVVLHDRSRRLPEPQKPTQYMIKGQYKGSRR